MSEAAGAPEVVLDAHLDAAALRRSDVVGLAMAAVERHPDLRDSSTVIFAVISELVSNAIEHGVLGLDSRMKDLPDGFQAYYRLREEALARLQDQDGWVRIGLRLVTTAQRPALCIRVEDSGAGYSPERAAPELPDVAAPPDAGSLSLRGRGLALVRKLCLEVRTLEGGRSVEAVVPLPRTGGG